MAHCALKFIIALIYALRTAFSGIGLKDAAEPDLRHLESLATWAGQKSHHA